MLQQQVLSGNISDFFQKSDTSTLFWKVGNWWILAFGEMDHFLWNEEGFFFNDQLQKEEKKMVLENYLKKMDLEDSGQAEMTKKSFPFTGGIVGITSYDAGLLHLGLAPKSKKTPFSEWRGVRNILCQKEGSDDLHLVFRDASFADLVSGMQKKSLPSSDFSLQKFTSCFEKKCWEEGFDRLKKDIFQGEIYQANLTEHFSSDFSGSEKALFLALAEQTKAPQSAFFSGQQETLLSLSPELFLHFSGSEVKTQPIKGTRPRKNDSISDENMRKELLESSKEKAELLMITDLLRNDLRQGCSSVEVEDLRAIQKNPTVWHTLSTIVGTRNLNFSSFDILKKCLPGGSITGCPKYRAAQILSEIEPHARGYFCGTFGFLRPDMSGEFSLLIRSLLFSEKKMRLQVGGGITAESKKEEEYEELFAKARVFFEMASLE